MDATTPPTPPARDPEGVALSFADVFALLDRTRRYACEALATLRSRSTAQLYPGAERRRQAARLLVEALDQLECAQAEAEKLGKQLRPAPFPALPVAPERAAALESIAGRLDAMTIDVIDLAARGEVSHQAAGIVAAAVGAIRRDLTALRGAT